MCSEIIGIIGTLLGTVIGWALSVLSQKGRLHFYTEMEDRFEQNDRYGGSKQCHSRDQADYYSYDLVLDVYNASAESKIMRNIILSFCDGRKELFRVIPNDSSTRRLTGAIIQYDKVQPLTIPAKSVIRMNLRGGLNNKNDEFEKIWETKKIVLSYCGKKNREKHIVVRKKDYMNYWQ